MDIHYQTTDRDYLALLDQILSGSILGRQFSRFAWASISGLAWLSVLLPYLRFHEMTIGFWARAVFALIITVGFPRLYSLYTTRCFAGMINAQTTVGLTGPSVLSVQDTFVEQTTSITTTRRRWLDIDKIVVTDTHLFLFFTPLVAAPIPRNTFASEIDWRAFHKSLEEKFTAAKQSRRSHGEELPTKHSK